MLDSRRSHAFLAILVLTLGLVSPFETYAGEVEYLSAAPDFLVGCTLEFSPDDLAFRTHQGYDVVDLPGCEPWGVAGKPRVPARVIRLALPPGMKVSGVSVRHAEEKELSGTFNLLPVQPPVTIGWPSAVSAFAEPDPAIYSSPGPYPASVVNFLSQADLAGQNMADISVTPLRYMPQTGRLSLITSLEMLIEGTAGRRCGDYLPERTTPGARRSYERMVRAMVDNADDVVLREDPGMDRVSSLDPGSYEYVIITLGEWEESFQPLADWRTMKGIPTSIVTIEWIFNSGGYPGSYLEQIRAFIADAHLTWGATYFLLGGDTNIIPFHTRTITVPGYETADIPNDTYFADYDYDWVCEVNIGRAPVRGTANIGPFIQKVLTYEKNPPLSDYITTAAYFGFDISETGDANGENSKELIRELFLPASWTLDTEYDSEPGLHREDVIAYLDQGHHLVNHHDHCSDSQMGTGWISHAQTIGHSDVNGLTNGDRLSIVFAVGCHPADFSVLTCIGESFVKNPAGGAVAFIGNTRTGWGGPPDDPHHYTTMQDRYFYRNIFEDGVVRLGENFSDLKNDAYSSYDPYNLHQYCFTQLHLLGEPELAVWTADPQELTVSHDPALLAGETTTFTVQVEGDGGPVEGATVCLCKPNDIYEVAETTAGLAVFELTPATPGTVAVTVSRQNCLPYEGAAPVLDLPASVTSPLYGDPSRAGLVDIRPNPFNPLTEITYRLPPTDEKTVTCLRVYDCRGRLVRTLLNQAMPGGAHRVTWDGRDDKGREVASGVYYSEMRSGELRDTRKLVITR